MTVELFLDTSTDKGIVALWKEGALVDERLLKAGPFSSSSLFPALQQFLAENQTRLCDVQHFSAGTGPGSFTGLRVAAAIQQTLAFTQGLSWRGISSLCLWTPRDPGSFVAMVDARSGGIYCQAVHWDLRHYRILIPAARLSVEQAVSMADLHEGRIVTPQAAALRARLPSALQVEEVDPSTRQSFPWVERDPAPVIQYGSTLSPPRTLSEMASQGPTC